MAKKGGEGKSGCCCTEVPKKRWQKRADKKEVAEKRWQKRVGKATVGVAAQGCEKRGGRKEVTQREVAEKRLQKRGGRKEVAKWQKK